MEERPQFRVEYMTPSAEVGIVVLEGEIDIYSAPQFKEVLLNGIEGGARRVIVDLSDVTFIDSTALGVLVSGAKRVRPRSVRVTTVSRAACPIRRNTLPWPERWYLGSSRRVASKPKANTLRMAVAPAAEATRLP